MKYQQLDVLEGSNWEIEYEADPEESKQNFMNVLQVELISKV